MGVFWWGGGGFAQWKLVLYSWRTPIKHINEVLQRKSLKNNLKQPQKHGTMMQTKGNCWLLKKNIKIFEGEYSVTLVYCFVGGFAWWKLAYALQLTYPHKAYKWSVTEKIFEEYYETTTEVWYVLWCRRKETEHCKYTTFHEQYSYAHIHCMQTCMHMYMFMDIPTHINDIYTYTYIQICVCEHKQHA